MTDNGRIELKKRTEGETKSYIEGFLSAVNKFIYWLRKEPFEQAINTMLQISRALNSTIEPKESYGDCRDRLKKMFREASEAGGDLFHLSQIERIIDGEDWL